MPEDTFGDYNEYLEKMTESLNESSKSLLPYYFDGRQRILDVGCADGVMLEKIREICPNAELTGLDINPEAADRARKKGFNIIEKPLEYVANYYNYKYKNDRPTYDAILFSSVLHEISSYDKDYGDRFTSKPIERAMQNAISLLEPGGIIVIRDGIKCSSNSYVEFKFVNDYDFNWIFKFVNSPAGKNMKADFRVSSSGVITTDYDVFREFLMKYTWGEQSWDRESQEIVGILTKKDWISVVSQHPKLEIIKVSTSSEKYIEHLEDRIICDDLSKVLSECMITIIVRKESVNAS